MKIYAISDTHFSHQKLVEYGRPKDFSAQILDSIAAVSGDLLIHCGDFCIGNDDVNMRMYMDAASGFKKKVLVRGNHDNKSNAWYTDRGFDLVCESFSARYFGKRLLFTHIPAPASSRFDHNVHGHLHGNAHRLEGDVAALYSPGYHLDLAPEIHAYKPVRLDTLLANM